jgi:hypothetical protein
LPVAVDFRSAITRPSARSEFGWRRPFDWCGWQRRRSLQKNRRRVRRGDRGSSVPTRGAHRHATHPLATPSDPPQRGERWARALSACLFGSFRAPLRIAAGAARHKTSQV